MNPEQHLRLVAGIGSMLAVVGTAQAQSASIRVSFEQILMTGEDAPGFEAGRAFLAGGIPGGVTVMPPRIDESGEVGFGGLVEAPSFPLDQALWFWREGAITLLARSDAPAPGTSSAFDAFPSVYFVDSPEPRNGRAVLHASLTQTGAVAGSWLHAEGINSLVVLNGDPVPGAPAGSTFLYAAAQQAANGALVVTGQYSEPGTSVSNEKEGFWRDTGAGLGLVIRDSMQAPGMPLGVEFGAGTSLAYWATFDEWSVNALGRVAFNAYLKGPNVTELDDEGIWAEDDDGLRLVVAEGDPAPGAGHGAIFRLRSGFRTFGTVHHVAPRLNAAGHVLFGAAFSNGRSDHGEGLWTTRSGQLELVARAFPLSEGVGGAAPGLPDHVFTSLDEAFTNERDHVAFSGHASDGSSSVRGIWWDVPGTPSLVVRHGDPVPIPGGAILTGQLKLLQLTDGDDLLFSATASTGGTGLFLARPDGALHALLWSGLLVDVSGDGTDRRVLTSWSTTAANANLEVPLFLRFTDGSEGLFVARVSHRSGLRPERFR